ncbi:glutamate racemase [Phytohalomonas tamaricis]|uniref:glutamate racemase n=1 Tax=Phytohalomonas tamaricis TaxID=2081032 RepID=UPI000D0B5B98|nr:glutamate racemase [Phytohalomonas tamaricis]
MHEGAILIFDSGVGGLSVVGEIRACLGDAALVYVCDNAALPYGTKPDEWLIERIVAVCCCAVERSRASVLVVACNTASTLALEALRSRLTIPVVGTVPAIKPAAQMSASKVIGLLATSATVRRPYTDRLIEEYASECRVIRVAADGLVAEAERYLAGRTLSTDKLRHAVQPLFDIEALDTVVLGCTHFPLLREPLAALAPRELVWIDSGAAIARRVASVISCPAKTRGVGMSMATAPGQDGLAHALAHFGFAAPEPLMLEDLSVMPESLH